MNLPYFLRLVSLCLACFFLVYAALTLLVWSVSPAAIRLGDRMRPRQAACLLLALRLSPAVLATLAVLGLCVPSYLWLEPVETPERVGLTFAAAAFFGVVVWGISISRALRAFVGSSSFTRQCRRLGSRMRLQGMTTPLIVVDGEGPLLAMAGILNRRIVISHGVLRALSAEQLEAALGHERAHGAARDNLKRLLLLLSPEVLPYSRRLAALERAWFRTCEWAADDDAIGLDANRSIPLAEALVQFARMGAAPQLSPLLTSFVPAGHDLAARVERLLRVDQTGTRRARRGFSLLYTTVGLLITAVFAAVMLRPSALYSVHSLLERLVH